MSLVGQIGSEYHAKVASRHLFEDEVVWISKWFRRIVDRYAQGKVHTDTAYREAHEFKNQYNPKEDVDYEWVSSYAKFVFEQFERADETLDAKAENIIRILGGGTGLLTLGAIANVAKINVWTAACLVLALALALIAIFVASWARIPRETYLPPSICWALIYADHYGSLAESKFLAQWHLTCEGLRLTIRNKARLVTISTWCFGLTLLALALSFVFAVTRIEG
jgi:hypothetical protein